MRANFIFSEVWIGLRRNLTMTIAVILTVAIGMAMLGVGLLIWTQVNMMKDFWYDKVEVSVFMCHDKSSFPACKGKGITEEQRTALEAKIKSLPAVEKVYFENQAQAFENFKSTANNPTLVNVTKVEDMPESFRVKLKDPSKTGYDQVIQAVTGQPGVSNVQNQQELLGKFFGLLDKLQWAAIVVAVALVLASILLIGNTVRLSAYNRRRETGIMRLVGASNLYIQLPFVMEGLIAGLIGGVLAAVLLIVTKVMLFENVQSYLAVGSALGWDSVATVILVSLFTGVFICVLASFVTLRRYLRV